MRLACVMYRLRFSGQLVEILDNFGKLLRIYANTVYLRKSIVNMATATTTFPPKQQITTRVYFKGCFPQAPNRSVINEMQTRCLAFVKKFTQQMVLLNSPLRMLLVHELVHPCYKVSKNQVLQIWKGLSYLEWQMSLACLVTACLLLCQQLDPVKPLVWQIQLEQKNRVDFSEENLYTRTWKYKWEHHNTAKIIIIHIILV